MLSWALRSLWADRVASLAGAAGVAMALLLAIVVEGVFHGEADQIVAYVDRAGADVWVMQEGVSNMHMASSFVHRARIDEVAALEGVQNVEDILYVNGFVEVGGTEWFVYVVGLRPEQQLGGPWAMSEGVERPGPGEVVVPDVIARRSGAGLGGAARIAETALRIVGLSRHTYSMANPVVFVARDDLAAVMSAGESTSYLLVQLEDGADARKVAARIEAEVDDVSALVREEFVESDRAMAMHMGADVIALMSAVGSTVAALLVAFTVYSAALRRRRELAVAAALGAGEPAIVAAVLTQSVVITALGWLGAVVIALVMRPLLAATVPEVTVSFPPATLLGLALPASAIAVLAGWWPARHVARTDPAEAFR